MRRGGRHARRAAARDRRSAQSRVLTRPRQGAAARPALADERRLPPLARDGAAALAARITTTIPAAERHLALPGRPRRPRRLPSPRRARRGSPRRPGVAKVWPNVTYRPLLDRSPQLIGAAADVGQPTFSTAGNGIKIGIIDDGVDQAHPFFNPAGYTMPPGFPKGNTPFTTAKVIAARAFSPPTNTWKYAKHPVRPGAVRARDPRRRDRRRQLLARRDPRPRPALRGRPARVSRQLQGADRPDRELRPERQRARDRRRDRGGRPRRHGRDQPLARRGGDRAEPRPRRHRDQRGRRRRRRARDRRRERLRRLRRRQRLLPGQRREGDHRRRGDASSWRSRRSRAAARRRSRSR